MKKLIANLDKNIIAPIYVISGNDFIIMKGACQKIEDSCEIRIPEIDKSIFDDDNFDVEKIILSCNQLPMTAKKHFVLVKNIWKCKDSDIKKINEYATNPVLDTVLVFLEIPSVSTFGKVIAEKVICKKLESYELAKIIRDKLIGKKQITDDAVNTLIDFCNKDLLQISLEVFKLEFLPETVITEKEIIRNVSKSDEYSIFEITSSLTKGDVNRSIILLKNMLQTMQFPMILGLISSHFRKILYSNISDGTSEEIASCLGVKEFSIKKAKTQSKGLTLPNILKINERILDIDYNIKNGKMSVENAMYFLIFSICGIVKGNINDK